MSAFAGTVLSHTVIRMPGRAHSEDAPFMLLLVRTDAGKNILGHFADRHPPPIGSRVKGNASENETPVFSKE
jgi:uncharacterized OB-fold protein